jgi:hypothetical protein
MSDNDMEDSWCEDVDWNQVAEDAHDTTKPDDPPLSGTLDYTEISDEETAYLSMDPSSDENKEEDDEKRNPPCVASPSLYNRGCMEVGILIGILGICMLGLVAIGNGTGCLATYTTEEKFQLCIRGKSMR